VIRSSAEQLLHIRPFRSAPGSSSKAPLRQNVPDNRATVLHGSMRVTDASRSGMRAAVCTAVQPPYECGKVHGIDPQLVEHFIHAPSAMTGRRHRLGLHTGARLAEHIDRIDGEFACQSRDMLRHMADVAQKQCNNTNGTPPSGPC
jgi:hypothetical protein